MRYILDTNVISALSKEHPQVEAQLDKAVARGDDIMLSAITYFEAKRGLVHPDFTRKLLLFEAIAKDSPILPLDKPALDRAITVYATLRASGDLIEDNDILIAATALAHDGILVTHNQKHFRRIAGLTLEDWQTTP